MNKYFIRVNNASGEHLGYIGDVSDIFFKKNINGGVGELRIKLPRLVTDFGEGDLISLEMNNVEVIVVNTNNPNGKVIYSGYIDSYNAIQGASGEYVDIYCLGYGSLLSRVIYKDSSDVTMQHNSTKVDVIFKDIVDQYLVHHPDSPVNYSSTSYDTTGNTISQSFNSMFCGEALDRLVERAGTDWYWYIDSDNIVYFKEKPSTATHEFIYGRDIVSDYTYTKSGTDITNRLLFWNGQFTTDSNPLSKQFQKTDTEDLYWKRWEKQSDSRIESATYAEQLGTAYLEAKYQPNHQISFNVISNSFTNLETIEAGDTCKITNVQDNAIFSDNMLITQVIYSMDYATIYVQDLRDLTSRNLTSIRRKLDRYTYDDGQPNVSAVTV